ESPFLPPGSKAKEKTLGPSETRHTKPLSSSQRACRRRPLRQWRPGESWWAAGRSKALFSEFPEVCICFSAEPNKAAGHESVRKNSQAIRWNCKCRGLLLRGRVPATGARAGRRKKRFKGNCRTMRPRTGDQFFFRIGIPLCSCVYPRQLPSRRNRNSWEKISRCAAIESRQGR
ncbi:hypothetical protein CSUI_000970, partial [Cystoisospora suis]